MKKYIFRLVNCLTTHFNRCGKNRFLFIVELVCFVDRIPFFCQKLEQLSIDSKYSLNVYLFYWIFYQGYLVFDTQIRLLRLKTQKLSQRLSFNAQNHNHWNVSFLNWKFPRKPLYLVQHRWAKSFKWFKSNIWFVDNTRLKFLVNKKQHWQNKKKCLEEFYLSIIS